VPHLNCGDVKKITIVVPNMESQKKIVHLTRKVRDDYLLLDTSLAAKIDELTKLKSAILAQELQPQEAA
jgi:restriction endonuclease S subunit